MEDPHTPLLPGGGKGPFISSSSEAANHAGKVPSQERQEGEMAPSASQDTSRDRDLNGGGTDHSIGGGSRQTQDAATKRKLFFFPSARFPFSLNKTHEARGETPLDRDCAGLVERIAELGRCAGFSSTLSDPTARLSEALRDLALTDVDSKARREAQFEVLLASVALTMVASREKVAGDVATTAKKIASDAAAVMGTAGSLEQQTARSNDYLFCITISGALALLPYLSTEIPSALQPYISVGFGLVFWTASVGAILSFKSTHQPDLKFADILNTLSFGGFSVLVTAFVCSALASGNIALIIICALLLLAGHLYAWSR